jgi:hypothetical protein
MQRLRLYDCRNSRLPGIIGKCQDDIPAIAGFVNSAQRRLLMCKEAGDEGWWGTWAEIVFNVSRAAPYITLPREIARLEAINVCSKPVIIQNQFFEYLTFGNGRLPKLNNRCNQGLLMGMARNNAVTFVEMTNAPQYLVAYATDARDYGKRVLFQGTDADLVTITSTDVANQVEGQFVNLAATPAMTPQTYTSINGIQKDVTVGIVRIYQHDPNTGDEILLLTMQPSEQTAGYRRYYLNQLPCGCCPNPQCEDGTEVQVTAIAKLDLIPVTTDTDYCLIQNLEAIIEECASVRYSEIDSPTAKQMSADRHHMAVTLLNGELTHYMGAKDVAVGVYPFGSAKLRRQKIGWLI